MEVHLSISRVDLQIILVFFKTPPTIPNCILLEYPLMKWLFPLLAYLYSALSLASPLPAGDVFKLETKKIDANTMNLTWSIKPGYFLYRERFSITVPEDANVQIGNIRFPEPQTKTDKEGRSIDIYRSHLTLTIPILGKQAGETLMWVAYQGCSDQGFCYPPQTQNISLSVNQELALIKTALYQEPLDKPEPPPAKSSADFASFFTAHYWPISLLIFFGFGLLLSFTPCVLPMVPVLSGIIVGHGPSLTPRKAFLLSLSYVVSMAFTYAVIAAIVATLGANLQVIMQSPWAIILFALIFVLLAFAMFGLFELRLPVSWQAKLALLNRRQGSGHYLGAAIMGCLSILILSPCVTAPLIGALSYIAQSGNILFGSLSLFFLGLGMGTPLLLIGTSAGHLLPKAGHWMNTVNYFFGVLLLGIAIYLLSRLMPPSLSMGLWAILLIFAGIFAGAMIPGKTPHDRFKQAVGIIMLVYGLLLLVGASMGCSNPLQPLAPWSNNKGEALPQAQVLNPRTLAEVNSSLEQAQGKPVMIDFYADWCASCKYLETTVLQNPKVLSLLKHVVVLKIDITANNEDDKAILKHFNVLAPPTFLFLNREGKELPELRLEGEVGVQEFLRSLRST